MTWRALSIGSYHLVYRSVTYDPVETAKVMAAAEQAAAAAAAGG